MKSEPELKKGSVAFNLLHLEPALRRRWGPRVATKKPIMTGLEASTDSLQWMYHETNLVQTGVLELGFEPSRFQAERTGACLSRPY